MELKIKIQPKQFEKFNYLFQLAIDSLKTNPSKAKEQFNFSEKDLENMELLRKKLVKNFINQHEVNTK